MAGHLKHKVVFAIAFVYYTCVPTLANSDRAGVRPRHASQKNVEPWVAAWQRHHQHPDLEMLPDQVQMLACSWQFHSFAEGYSKSNGCRYLAGFEYACASMAGRSSTCSSACAIRIPVGPESGYATLCDRDAMVSTWINGMTAVSFSYTHTHKLYLHASLPIHKHACRGRARAREREDGLINFW